MLHRIQFSGNITATNSKSREREKEKGYGLLTKENGSSSSPNNANKKNMPNRMISEEEIGNKNKGKRKSNTNLANL